MQLSDILSMASDAIGLFGKGGNSGNTIQNVIKAFQASQKYPKTMEGLQQALRDANISKEDAQKAFTMLEQNPRIRQFVDNKFPGSLKVLENHILGNQAKIAAIVGGKPDSPTPPQNTAIRELLNRAKI